MLIYSPSSAEADLTGTRPK